MRRVMNGILLRHPPNWAAGEKWEGENGVKIAGVRVFYLEKHRFDWRLDTAEEIIKKMASGGR